MAINLDEFDPEEQLDIQAELDEGYADIENQFSVAEHEGLAQLVVVDNVPVIDAAKKDRLVARLRQVFAKAGAPIEEEHITMPWDDSTGNNKGFIFLSYPDAPQAENAVRAINGLAFGKSTTLYANAFTDIERYANLPVGEGELPAGWKERAFAERDHLRSWLDDEAGRDQYFTFRDQQVGMWWNGRNAKADPVKDKDGKPLTNKMWGDWSVQWSPLGTYLASMHAVGVALWSGPKLDQMQKITHPGIRLLQFSPCENYLVTYSEEPLDLTNPKSKAVPDTFGHEDEGAQFVIWDVRSARPLRTFPGDQHDEAGAPGQRQWPVFKWSPDDTYVARCIPGSAIQVYELPGMGLLDKKSIKIEGVVDFEWCPMGDQDWADRKGKAGDADKKQTPRECMIACWVPEAENQPARVTIMSIPNRTVLRSKNLMNVTGCKFFWQSQGDYLCVKVDRHARKAKSKKPTFCNLEIVRLREKGLPVETIEHKDFVTTVAWEPTGNRFAIVSTNDPNFGQNIPGVTVKYNVSFYAPDQTKGIFVPFKTLEGKVANTLLWSPKGRHIVLATVGSPTKFDIEFYDLDFTLSDKAELNTADLGANVQLLSTGEHYGVTELAWDPSGRYLASTASAWRLSPEPGFNIWDFKGAQLVHQGLDKFKAFHWRPRPPTLLTKSQRRNLRKALKEYSRGFDEADQAEENRGSAEELAARQRAIAEWDAWRRRNNQRLAERRKALGKELGGIAEGEQEKIEEWIEESIDVVEEEQ